MPTPSPLPSAAWACADASIIAALPDLHSEFRGATHTRVSGTAPHPLGLAIAHNSSGSATYFDGSPHPTRRLSGPSFLRDRETGSLRPNGCAPRTAPRQPLVCCSAGCGAFVPQSLIAATYRCTAPVDPADHLAAGHLSREPVDDDCPYVFPPVYHPLCMPCALWYVDNAADGPTRPAPTATATAPDDAPLAPRSCPRCTAACCPCCDSPHPPSDIGCPYFAGPPADDDDPDRRLFAGDLWDSVPPYAHGRALARHPYVSLPQYPARPIPPPNHLTASTRPAPTAAPMTLGPWRAMPVPNRLPITAAITPPPPHRLSTPPACPPAVTGGPRAPDGSPVLPGTGLLTALRSPPPVTRDPKRRRVTFVETPPDASALPTDSPPRHRRPHTPRSPAATARASHEARFRARANALDVGMEGFIGSNEPHLTERRYLRDVMGGSLYGYLHDAGLFSSVPRIHDLFANDVSAEEIMEFAGTRTSLGASRRQAYYAALVRLGVPRECELQAWDAVATEQA
jgi:hypothetical protein